MVQDQNHIVVWTIKNFDIHLPIINNLSFKDRTSMNVKWNLLNTSHYCNLKNYILNV